MTTLGIRQKLHNYLEIADDKKVKAMYIMVEEDIQESSVEYSDELKKRVNRACVYCQRSHMSCASGNFIILSAPGVDYVILN